MPGCFKALPPFYQLQHYYVTVTLADGTTQRVYQEPTDWTVCDYIVLQPSEYGNWQQLVTLSVQDVQAIAPFIALVWATAWGFKTLRRSISISTERNEDA